MATELGNHLNLSGFLLHACLTFGAPSALHSVCECECECVGALCGSYVFVLPLLLLHFFFLPPCCCLHVGLLFRPGDRRRVCVLRRAEGNSSRSSGGLEAESFIHTGRHISVAGWCFFPPCLLEQHTHLGAVAWRSRSPSSQSAGCFQRQDARTLEPRGDQSGPRKC